MHGDMGYSALMAANGAFLEVKLDLDEPVEITDFAALFAGFGAEFERYLAHEHPRLRGAARMYVKEVRGGSVTAMLFADISDMVGLMDQALIVLTFGSLFSKRIRDFIAGKILPGANKPQIE